MVKKCRFGSFVLALLLAPCSLWAADRPNIVLIMCDDMGFSDIGCYGGEIQTPNIDRLAAEGMRFRQFYNNAKCTTTRASLITGLYPRKGGQGIELLDETMVTIPERLKSAGYQTALSGKWHLGSRAPHRPVDRGFDRFYGLMDGCCNFFDPAQPDPEFKGGRVRVFGRQDEIITEFPEDYYTTDAFTDYAVRYIGEFSASDRPFFLHVTYTAPHYPLHARPEDIARYRGKYAKGWKHLRQARYQRQLDMGLAEPAWVLPPEEPEVKPWKTRKDPEWDDLRMAVYAAMIDRMDQNIGRLRKALEDNGVADDTLVLFLSDNGGCAETPGGDNPGQIPGPREYYTHCGPGWAWAQNTPFRRYKTWMHEGGISTPLVARWPGKIKPGAWTDQVGHIIDFMPTFLEMAGVPSAPPKGKLPMEGESLMPAFAGKTTVREEPLFWFFAGNRAVRQGDWKLCWGRKRKQWELYDLSRDRTEMNDLSEGRSALAESLSKTWFDWANMTGVKY